MTEVDGAILLEALLLSYGFAHVEKLTETILECARKMEVHIYVYVLNYRACHNVGGWIG